MAYEDKSPEAIAEELGERLKQARLNSDLTQAEVAARAGVTRKVVSNAEKGRVQLHILIAIMAVLGLTQALDRFLPKQEISPMQLLKLRGKKRQRATGRRTVDNKDSQPW